MKHDPERDLWLPSRRSFFFFGASAAVGAILPPAPSAYWHGISPIVSLPPFLPELDPRLIWIEAATSPLETLLRLHPSTRRPNDTSWIDLPFFKAP